MLKGFAFVIVAVTFLVFVTYLALNWEPVPPTQGVDERAERLLLAAGALDEVSLATAGGTLVKSGTQLKFGEVKAGSVVVIASCPNPVTCPELTWEVRVDGVHVDPSSFKRTIPTAGATLCQWKVRDGGEVVATNTTPFLENIASTGFVQNAMVVSAEIAKTIPELN